MGKSEPTRFRREACPVSGLEGGVRFIRLPADNLYDDFVLSLMEMAKINIFCRYL